MGTKLVINLYVQDIEEIIIEFFKFKTAIFSGERTRKLSNKQSERIQSNEDYFSS